MYPVIPRFTLRCFLSFIIAQISQTFLWVSGKFNMYVKWRALISLGVAFWGLLCCTDLLGEPSWRKCSDTLDDILKGYKVMNEVKSEEMEAPKHKMSWPVLLWNVCAFLCSLVFCSIIRSMSWVVWKIFKIYNVFRNRKSLTSKIVSAKNEEPPSNLDPSNCQVIFQNQQFNPKTEILKIQQSLEEVKKEKDDLAQQLLMAQKENLTARQQIEEYKLETFMIKEKLARTTNSLRENLKYKDFASANHEMITRKAHNLEVHLREVSKDRDLLRSKLSTMEKHFLKVEEKLRRYEKDSESNMEQFPEKDTGVQQPTEVYSQPGETTEPELDMEKFQKKIKELQRSNSIQETKTTGFEGNSKISVDLEDSSFDTSKENDSEFPNQRTKSDCSSLKQNLINYSAYKTQMLRPKLRIENLRDKIYSQLDKIDTTSSSDENSAPHRIISSTAEFQNFLKTLTSNSSNNVHLQKSNVF